MMRLILIGAALALLLGGTWLLAENPEPARLILMGIGAVALLGYGWRRRKRTTD